MFDYVAGQPVQEAAPAKVKSSGVRVEDVVDQLRGQCASGVSGYWTYEVCIGDKIRQYHGADSYMLGEFKGVSGKKIQFDQGLPCDPPSNPTPRRVEVSLACSENPAIQLISEPSTCQYTMTLCTPLVCSDSSYPKLMAAPSGGGGAAPDDGHEDWILQVRAGDDGSVTCSARTTEIRPAGSHLSFSSFSLTLDSDAGSVDVEQGSARRMGRVPLSGEELAVEGNSIKNGGKFKGKLSYLELSGKTR